MVEGITEKKLGDFQEFEDWLDKLQLLDLEVLYRGHAKSTWKLESTLYRHRLTLFKPYRDRRRPNSLNQATAACS